jgi:hypothetical protein
MHDNVDADDDDDDDDDDDAADDDDGGDEHENEDGHDVTEKVIIPLGLQVTCWPCPP